MQETAIRITEQTLYRAATDLLRRLDQARAHGDKESARDCAFEAVGMLRAFVDGLKESTETHAGF